MFGKFFKLVLLCVMTAVPPCQVQKASHPLFEYCAGPSGFYRVAVSTCPGFRSRQVRLSWTSGTPWPWLDQKPPFSHNFKMACCSVALRFFKFAHIVSVGDVVADGVTSRIVGTTLGY